MKKGDAICFGSNGVCSVTTIGLFKKRIVPPPRVEYIDSFEVDPPRYSVKFTVTPVEIHVLPKFLVCHPGILTTFTLTPWKFPLISSTGGYIFF